MAANELQITIKNLEESDLPRLRNFSCGNLSMDNFLQQEAYLYHTTGEGITRILINEDNNDILGYCTLRCGLWKIYDPTMYDDYREIPCIEVSRLAVHSFWQHQQQGTRLGFALMKYIILFIINNIATQVGCRFITLYSVPEKVNWYSDCFGFVVSNPDTDNPPDQTVPMHLDLYGFRNELPK